MTDKMEKLANEAGWGNGFCEEFDLGKFAELIVQECANACLSATEPGSSVHLVSVAYADAVKKRFGIA